jgi:hypothetical protein
MASKLYVDQLAGSGGSTITLVAGQTLDTSNGTLTIGTDISVTDGGTGASTLTDGGVLVGSGTGAITAMAVLADGELIVGDGTTDPVAESGATLRTSIGVGTGDSPTFAGLTATGTVGVTGNVTATGTVEPAGDTAAGDNAAIGYTAAEGLILTGQGSTNDVTIKNDADTDVISIPTGATGVVLAGALTLGGAIAGADNQVGRVNLIDYGEVTNAIGGTGGGTQDIDLTLGNNVVATVDTSTNTFTFSNPTASDELCGFTLFLTNGGSQTVNWPAAVDWAGATAPTLTTSGLDILVFITTDGGTIWHGMVGSADSS